MSFYRLWQVLCATSVLVLAGCTAPNQATVVEAVGPAPRSQLGSESDGYLVVYSAWSNFVDQGSTGHHSRYRINSDDGKLSREVINHVDRFDEGPIQLPLPPGAYHISARAAHFGRVNLAVLIQPHQTTFVYLDGANHRNAPEDQSKVVKLPNGQIVGWSATVAGNTGR